MRMWVGALAGAMVTAAFTASGPAQAAQYVFAITGPQTINFALNSSPTPSFVDAGNFFRIDGVSGTVNGNAATFDLGFGSPSYSLNFGFLNPSSGTAFTSNGPSLYTGSEAAPTFKLGTFSLAPNSSITIAAAPEPASWAMMIAGFGIAGGALRRSRKLRATITKVAFA